MNTLEDLWSLKPVLYRISSPFIKLDYIGRSSNWFRRYCEHRRDILNSQDSLPCYKYIRDHHPSTWFSLPLMETPTVVAMEPQVIGRFEPRLNKTFNYWAKYSNSVDYCDLSKFPKNRFKNQPKRTVRKMIARQNYRALRRDCDAKLLDVSTVQSYKLARTMKKTVPMAYSLCTFLQTLRSHRAPFSRVAVDPGKTNMTDFAYLQKCYGSSRIIATNLCSVSLSSVLTDIIPFIKVVPDAVKHNRTWIPFFTIGVTYTPITENFEKDLRDIATKNRRGINYLKNAPITSLITLQLHALKSDLKPALAVKARSLIAKTLRLNHQRYIHAYPTFKVPTSTIGSSEYRELIFYMVRSVNHDHELQQLLLSNTRIISTKHRSIADMIHNHIAFAKAQPTSAPAECACARHLDLPRDYSTQDGIKHIGLKITELADSHPLSIIGQCSRNVPVPCTDFQTRSLILSFRDFLEDIVQARVSMAKTNIHSDTELRSYLDDNWRSDPQPIVQRAVFFLFTRVPGDVIDSTNKRIISACMHRCFSSISKITTTTGSAEIFSGLHRQYTPLIFSPLDKNAGSTLTCCP